MPNLKGHFSIEVNGKTVACFENLILSAGVEALAQNAQRTRCSLGTGTTPPSLSDTDLETEVIATTTISDFFFWYGTDPFSVTHTLVYDFTVPAEGLVFTEVGVGSAGELLSRSLVKTLNGAPTRIKINGDESLRVVHSITHTPSIVDNVFTTDINGSTHQVTIRPAGIGDNLVWRSVAGDVTVASAEFFETFELTDVDGSGNGSGASVFDIAAFPATPVAGGINYPLSLLDYQAETLGTLGGIYVDLGGNAVASTGMEGIAGAYQISFSPPVTLGSNNFIFNFTLDIL